MALTTSDHHYEQVQRAAVLRDMADKFYKVAREGGDLLSDPDWVEFERMRPNVARDMLEKRKIAAARNSLLDMISECTGPLPPLPDSGPYVPDIITLTQRTNKLLAAILLKLHGIE